MSEAPPNKVELASAERATLDVGNYEGGRVSIPKGIVENAISPRLTGTGKMTCWLIVLGLGRYRVADRKAISKVLASVEEVASAGEIVDFTDRDQRDAIPARLIPCTISAAGPMWRLYLPEAVRRLAPEGETASHVFLLIVAGFIEVWFPDTLRRAMEVPLSEVI